jgi:hypothetical protein
MRYIKHIILSISALLLIETSFAQLRSVKPEDEKIICSAMKDEMKRAYDSLRKPDFESPFYIATSLLWGSRFYCTAKMGVLYNTGIFPLRESNMRLMVGNYDMNDENFEPSNYYPESLGLNGYFELPTEAEYFSIRRNLWQNSEDLYRSANGMYKLKKAAVQKKGGVYQADGLQDFTPVKPFTLIESPDPVMINLDSVKRTVTRISEFFDRDTLITDASVSFSLENKMTYYMNTEGSESHRRYVVASIFLSVSVKDKTGTDVSNTLNFVENDYHRLPSENQLLEACKYLKEKTLAECITDTIPEDYSGPLLILDAATADYFEEYLFSGQNALVTDRESFKEEVVVQTIKENKSDDQKYNKRIFSRDLNVMDCSGLNQYKGIPLYGHYTIDNDGIAPVDSLILVKDGIIKNMLNNRIPTPMQRTPNGHMRGSGIGQFSEICPGVLVVTTNNPADKSSLKTKLLEEAEDRNLEYAYILKPRIVAGKYCGRNLYRIEVATGEEKLVRHSFYTGGTYNQTKPERILAMSGNLIVHNTYFKSADENPTSYIVPDGVLIELTNINFENGNDVEVKKTYVPYPPFE